MEERRQAICLYLMLAALLLRPGGRPVQEHRQEEKALQNRASQRLLVSWKVQPLDGGIPREPLGHGGAGQELVEKEPLEPPWLLEVGQGVPASGVPRDSFECQAEPPRVVASKHPPGAFLQAHVAQKGVVLPEAQLTRVDEALHPEHGLDHLGVLSGVQLPQQARNL